MNNTEVETPSNQQALTTTISNFRDDWYAIDRKPTPAGIDAKEAAHLIQTGYRNLNAPGLDEAVAAEIAAQEGTKWETLRARSIYLQNARDILTVIRNYEPKEES